MSERCKVSLSRLAEKAYLSFQQNEFSQDATGVVVPNDIFTAIDNTITVTQLPPLKLLTLFGPQFKTEEDAIPKYGYHINDVQAEPAQFVEAVLVATVEEIDPTIWDTTHKRLDLDEDYKSSLLTADEYAYES